MKGLFKNQTFAMFFGSVAALVVGTWLINPQSGLIGWISHGGWSVAAFGKILIALGILLVGAGVTYIAMRLATSNVEAAYAGGGSLNLSGLRLLRIPEGTSQKPARTAEDAGREKRPIRAILRAREYWGGPIKQVWAVPPIKLTPCNGSSPLPIMAIPSAKRRSLMPIGRATALPSIRRRR